MIAHKKKQPEREFYMKQPKIKRLEIETCITILTRAVSSELIPRKIQTSLDCELVKLRRARKKKFPNDESDSAKKIVSILLAFKEQNDHLTFDHPSMDDCEQYALREIPIKFSEENEFRIIMYAAYHLAATLR